MNPKKRQRMGEETKADQRCQSFFLRKANLAGQRKLKPKSLQKRKPKTCASYKQVRFQNWR
jgi:hypothetical protein